MMAIMMRAPIATAIPCRLMPDFGSTPFATRSLQPARMPIPANADVISNSTQSMCLNGSDESDRLFDFDNMDDDVPLSSSITPLSGCS